MNSRLLICLAVLTTLSGCISRPDRPRGTPYKPPAQTVVVRGNDPAVLKQCLGKLDRLVARYALLPDRVFAGSCDALGSVQLRDIGTPTSRLVSAEAGHDPVTGMVVSSAIPVAVRKAEEPA